MACTSLVALPRACGSAGVMAGLQKMYIISYADLAAATGATNGEVFTTSTGGMVNAIGTVSGKKFVEVGLLRSSSGLNETLTKNLELGIAYLTQTMTLVLSDLTSDNLSFLDSVLSQQVAVILKTRSGQYVVAGLNGQFELEKAEGGTGIKEGDHIGYTLTFNGFSTTPLALVDPTIVPTLIA